MVVFVIGLNYKISIFFGFRFNILSELLYLQTQPLRQKKHLDNRFNFTTKNQTYEDH